MRFPVVVPTWIFDVKSKFQVLLWIGENVFGNIFSHSTEAAEEVSLPAPENTEGDQVDGLHEDNPTTDGVSGEEG